MYRNFAEVYFCIKGDENKCDYNQRALAQAKTPSSEVINIFPNETFQYMYL